MEELLQLLEKKIKQLKSSYQMVHQEQSDYMQEKEVFLAKQQRAINKIEVLITKLKAIENVL